MNTVDTVDINIATLNVRGLNRKDKRSIVYSWIKKIPMTSVFCKRPFVHYKTVLSLKEVGMASNVIVTPIQLIVGVLQF